MDQLKNVQIKIRKEYEFIANIFKKPKLRVQLASSEESKKEKYPFVKELHDGKEKYPFVKELHARKEKTKVIDLRKHPQSRKL